MFQFSLSFAENLEMLERGDMKFSSSYDHEIDNFGDSCGSAEEQSEGSDSEQEEQGDTVNVDTVNTEPQYEYIVKEEILSDLDVEVGGASIVCVSCIYYSNWKLSLNIKEVLITMFIRKMIYVFVVMYKLRSFGISWKGSIQLWV